jgi:MFS family permease
VVESYALAAGVAAAARRRARRPLGRRRVFLLGVLVFGIASVACMLSQTVHQLIGARALQGLGAACWCRAAWR